MKRADQLAKLGCKKSTPSTFTFSSLSHTLSQINEVNPLRRWKEHIDKNPIKETSFFYRPSFILHPHLKVPKWFKPISRPITSRLNQAITGHGYIQSYFERFNITCKSTCDCANESTIPAVPQTREHIFKACVHHELARIELWKTAPRIDNPRWHSSNLLMESLRKPLVQFFQDSGAFSRKHSLAITEPSSGRQKHEKRKRNLPSGRRQSLGQSHEQIPGNVENAVSGPIGRETQRKRQTPSHRARQDQRSSFNNNHGQTDKAGGRSGEHSRPNLEQPTGLFHLRQSSPSSPSADPSIGLISQPIDQPKDPTGPG